MTESDWFASISPEPMLEHLGKGASPRKRLLFACACVRRIWPILEDERLRKCVTVAERFADGKISVRVLAKARRLARRERRKRETQEQREGNWRARAARAAAQAIGALLAKGGPILIAPSDVRDPPDVVSATRSARTAARAAEAEREENLGGVIKPIRRLASHDAVELMHEIFGNPFRLLALDPRWLDWKKRMVPRMARVIYRKRCFRNLPVLADALEKGGCCDDALLSHCRAPMEHVRGCWVVDLLLGKQ
jgi:hypothetical protein